TTRRSSSVSGARAPAPSSPQSVAFPPPPPPASRLCSAASQVVCDCPTSHRRTCRTCGQRPSPADPPHQSGYLWDLPVPVQGVSPHAQGLATARGPLTACPYRLQRCCLPLPSTASAPRKP